MNAAAMQKRHDRGMGSMDVVVGSFATRSDARAAAAHLASALQLDSQLIATERVRFPGDRRGVRRNLLVAWVPAERRRTARELIWQHHGRQAPLDWYIGRQERVAPETFPDDSQAGELPPKGSS